MRKALIIASTLLLLLAAGLFLINWSAPRPPPNDVVARRFNEGKAKYEQLRDMLLADKPITLVAPWGVEKIGGPIGTLTPPIAEMPSDQYQKYLNLLSGLGAKAISKQFSQHSPEICILIWRAGLGDAIHVAVCWLKNDPRQRSSKGAVDGDVYFPLGERWYVRRDYTW